MLEIYGNGKPAYIASDKLRCFIIQKKNVWFLCGECINLCGNVSVCPGIMYQFVRRMFQFVRGMCSICTHNVSISICASNVSICFKFCLLHVRTCDSNNFVLNGRKIVNYFKNKLFYF